MGGMSGGRARRPSFIRVAAWSALVIATAVIVVYLWVSRGLEYAVGVVSILGFFALGLIPIIAKLITSRGKTEPNTQTKKQAAAARQYLADQVLAQWKSEVAVRQVDRPAPIVVRCGLAD